MSLKTEEGFVRQTAQTLARQLMDGLPQYPTPEEAEHQRVRVHDTRVGGRSMATYRRATIWATDGVRPYHFDRLVRVGADSTDVVVFEPAAQRFAGLPPAVLSGSGTGKYREATLDDYLTLLKEYDAVEQGVKRIAHRRPPRVAEPRQDSVAPRSGLHDGYRRAKALAASHDLN